VHFLQEVFCVKSLLRQLREVFPKEPLPERPITTHCCPDCDNAEKLLGGQHWPEVADAFPPECPADFVLLTPVAQQYYLPAFMVSVFRSNGLPVDSLESALAKGRLTSAFFTPLLRAAIGRWGVEECGRRISLSGGRKRWQRHNVRFLLMAASSSENDRE